MMPSRGRACNGDAEEGHEVRCSEDLLINEQPSTTHCGLVGSLPFVAFFLLDCARLMSTFERPNDFLSGDVFANLEEEEEDSCCCTKGLSLSSKLGVAPAIDVY
jgi:hypothetical protein